MSENLRNIRKAVMREVDRLAKAWSEYPLKVETEGRRVDPDRQTHPYLCVKVLFGPSMQADLNTNPHHRITGVIELVANVKKGEGPGKADLLLEHFYSALHLERSQNLGPVRTYAATFAAPDEGNSWIAYTVMVPFWADVRY